MRRKKEKLEFGRPNLDKEGLVPMNLTVSPTYADMIEFRKVLFHQGVSPGQLLELLIRKISLRDEMVLKLVEEAKENTTQKRVESLEVGAGRKKDAEEIYNVIEMALEDQQRQVGGG